MHHLLRVLQGEVELQVVQVAAAPLAQQLQVSRVELHLHRRGYSEISRTLF